MLGPMGSGGVPTHGGSQGAAVPSRLRLLGAMMGTHHIVRRYDVIIDEEILEEIGLKGYSIKDLFEEMTRITDNGDAFCAIHYVETKDATGTLGNEWVCDDEVSSTIDTIVYTITEWECTEVGHDIEE